MEIKNLVITKLTLVLCAVFILLLSACTKEKANNDVPIFLPGDATKGHIFLKKNGRNMTASAQTKVCQLDENHVCINFFTYNESNVLAEYFQLECINLIGGIQPLCLNKDMNCPMWAHYESVIANQTIDSYILDTSKNNFIQLTQIDTAGRWISGKLEMHFNRDKSKPKGNPANPEKVSFTEGNFSMYLPD